MGSPKTCPVCEDFAAACRHPAHYATPPAPADDASGAEAMREAFVAHMATVGVTDVAWTNALGPVGTRADHYGVMLSVEWERFAAGYRAALPARDDAVEEALTAAQALIRHLSQGMAGLARADDDMERLYFVPKIVAAYPEFSEVGAKIDAALRREKESRSDDSRPASGQGGA